MKFAVIRIPRAVRAADRMRVRRTRTRALTRWRGAGRDARAPVTAGHTFAHVAVIIVDENGRVGRGSGEYEAAIDDNDAQQEKQRQKGAGKFRGCHGCCASIVYTVVDLKLHLHGLCFVGRLFLC